MARARFSNRGWRIHAFLACVRFERWWRAHRGRRRPGAPLSPPRMQWIPAPAYAGVTPLPGNDFMECRSRGACPPRKRGSGGPSIRVGTSIFCYPNPMIGEFVVGLGDFHFRHMAGHAFPLGHGAAPGGTHRVGRGVFSGKTMAGQALGIVKSSVTLGGLMGIMASEAADAWILRVITTATCQAITLEASCVNAKSSRHGGLQACLMAGPAKASQITCRQVAGIKDVKLLEVSRLDGSDVFLAGPMASLATYARNHFVQIANEFWLTAAVAYGSQNTSGVNRSKSK